MKSSLIIPYHFEDIELLEKLLCSVRSQISFDFSKLETIIVANFSLQEKPEYEAALQSIKHKFNSLNIAVAEETIPGPSAARNKGIELANGEYILFADCDDVYASNNVFCQFMQDVTACPSVDYISYDFIETVSKPNSPQMQFITHHDSDIWSFAKIYKREFLNRYNIRFSEELKVYEDTHFCRLCKALANDPRHSKALPVYYWVNREGSTIRSGGERQRILNHEFMFLNLVAISRDKKRIEDMAIAPTDKLQALNKLEHEAVKWVIGSALDVLQLSILSNEPKALESVVPYITAIKEYAPHITSEWFYSFVQNEKLDLFMQGMEYKDALKNIECIHDLIFNQ